MSGLLTAILGMVLIVALPLHNNSGRLAGYYLTQASPTPFVALLSLISSNVAGYTKKTTVAAMYLIGYCTGNIIGAYSTLILRKPRPKLNSNIRPSDIPCKRRAPVCSCRDHYYCVLGRVSRHLSIHTLLLCLAEQAERED